MRSTARPTSRRPRAGTAFGRSLPAPAGPRRGARRGALYVRHGDRGAAAHQAAALAASARKHHRDRQGGRARRSRRACGAHARGRPAATVLDRAAREGPGWTRTIPACSTTSSASSARRLRPSSRRRRRPRKTRCRRLKVDYEILPAVFDPEQAIAPGAPILHGDKTPEHRVMHAAAQHRRGDPWRIWRRRRRAGGGRSHLSRAPSRPSVFSTRRWRPMAGSPGSMPTASSISAPARKCRS